MTGKYRRRVGLGLLLVLLVTATMRSAAASPTLPAVRAKFPPPFCIRYCKPNPPTPSDSWSPRGEKTSWQASQLRCPVLSGGRP